MIRCGFLFAVALGAAVASANPEEHYAARCAACHDAPADSKTPALAALKRMNSMRVRHALTRGNMRPHVEGLGRGQISALVDHLVGDQAALIPATAYCTQEITVVPKIARWGYDERNTRWQRDTAIDVGNVHALRLKWAFAVPNVSQMRSQPAVTDDTVFLPTMAGDLYALARDSGCIKWRYSADRPLRTAVSLGRIGGRGVLFVGDQGTAIHAVDANTGALVWKRDVAVFEASMATGAPVQHGDRLFVPVSAFDVALAMRPTYECCKSHGAVRALDAATGDILWTAHMTEDAEPTYKNSVGVQMWGPSGAAVWTTPAIDEKRGVLYVGTGENTSSPATEMSDAIVAIALEDGEIRWHFQGTANDAFNMACGRRAGPNCPKENGPDFDFGASVIIAQDSEGKDLLLAGQKSGDVYALDPDDNGALRWQRRIGPGSALGGVHWGITADETQVYVPIADPPFLGARGSPGVWAFRIDDGADVWGHAANRGCTPSGFGRGTSPWPDCPFHFAFSAAASIAGNVVLAGALDGRVFAFDRRDGGILWQFATNRSFETVNAIGGHGGAIDNPGVVAVDDLVFVTSGYGMFGQMPGNVLLVFELAPGTQPADSARGALPATSG
ncbi:MAG: PQQ-binding-like beta-propeller repeat protein [Gammaproteobacteria bacterium]|nr:PQQ-binding-like beta-propeller repeat protein [Gammaproteobacteria bacterium]